MVGQAGPLGCVMPYSWFEPAGSEGYFLLLDYPGVSPGSGRTNHEWLHALVLGNVRCFSMFVHSLKHIHVHLYLRTLAVI